MESTWGPVVSGRPKMDPMLAPWTLLSGIIVKRGPAGDGGVNCLRRCWFQRWRAWWCFSCDDTSSLRHCECGIENGDWWIPPAKMASNAENVSIWWRHHEIAKVKCSSEDWPRLWEVWRWLGKYDTMVGNISCLDFTRFDAFDAFPPDAIQQEQQYLCHCHHHR